MYLYLEGVDLVIDDYHIFMVPTDIYCKMFVFIWAHCFIQT